MLSKKPGLKLFLLTASLLIMCFTVLSPFGAKADTSPIVPEISDQLQKISDIVASHLELDENTGKVIIDGATELISEIGSDYYDQLVDTTNKLNDAVQTFKGANYLKETIRDLTAKGDSLDMSGCSKITIASFLHVTAFSGLMTLAGIGGPVSFVLATSVAVVWLGASAAVGCLK